MPLSPVASDSFTGVDGAGLGANWTIAYNGGFLINTNAARSNAPNVDSCQYYSGATFTNNQRARATVAAAPVTNFFALGVAVRAINTGGGRNYCYIGLRGSSPERYLSRLAGGTPTALQHTTSAGILPNDVMELDAQGSLLQPIMNGANDTTLGNATDSTYTGGSCGIHCYNSSADARLDDFIGYNIIDTPITPKYTGSMQTTLIRL